MLKVPYLMAFVVLTVTGIASCTPGNKLRFFKSLPDSSIVHLPPIDRQERTVQKGDRLAITFGANDDDAAAIFNRYGGVPTSGTDLLPAGSQASAELAGYLIDDEGMVEFPMIGKVRAVGLTSMQLKDTLTRQASQFLKNPLITVRFLVFTVTVLGGVKSPGIYNLPLQKTTILDALGASGDLLRTAKSHNVRVYSDNNGQRSVRKIDLRNKNLLYNPQMFWLNHNDIIYVQTRRRAR